VPNYLCEQHCSYTDAYLYYLNLLVFLNGHRAEFYPGAAAWDREVLIVILPEKLRHAVVPVAY